MMGKQSGKRTNPDGNFSGISMISCGDRNSVRTAEDVAP